MSMERAIGTPILTEKAEKGEKGPKRDRPQRAEPCDAPAHNEMGDDY